MKKIKTKLFRLWGYKNLEFQQFQANTFIKIFFEPRLRCDNAGWSFHLCLIWLFHFVISFYDRRQWNEKEGRFYKDGEQEKESELSIKNMESRGFRLMYNDGFQESYYHNTTYLDNSRQPQPMFTASINRKKKLLLLTYRNFNTAYEKYVTNILQVDEFINFFTK